MAVTHGVHDGGAIARTSASCQQVAQFNTCSSQRGNQRRRQFRRSVGLHLHRALLNPYPWRGSIASANRRELLSAERNPELGSGPGLPEAPGAECLECRVVSCNSPVLQCCIQPGGIWNFVQFATSGFHPSLPPGTTVSYLPSGLLGYTQLRQQQTARCIPAKLASRRCGQRGARQWLGAMLLSAELDRSSLCRVAASPRPEMQIGRFLHARRPLAQEVFVHDWLSTKQAISTAPPPTGRTCCLFAVEVDLNLLS